MTGIKPWAVGPFEMLYHAETHFLKGDIIFYQQNRNDQYHNGGAGVPELHKLEDIRQAAIWIFSTLFDVTNTETILQEKIEAAGRDENPHIREREKDRAIDSEHGMTDIAGISYYTSEILFNVDYQAYREVGEELLSLQEPDEGNTEDS